MKTLIEDRSAPVGALAICLFLAASAPAIAQPPSTPSDSSTETPMAAAGGLYFYPKNGQSTDQQAADRYACYGWSVKESKFDPAAGAGTHQSGSGLDEFRRAMRACLEGRGYSVTAAPAAASSAPPPSTAPGPVKPFWAPSSAPELTYRPLEVQIDGGYTVAAGETNQTLSGGPNAGLGFTWFPTSALPAGLRVDGSWSRFDIKNRALNPGFSYGRQDIYGGDADLQLDLAHRSSRSKLYLLGGMGWYRVQTRQRQVAYESGTVCGWYYCVPGYFPTVVAEKNTTSDWQRSWNAGIGWEAAIAPGSSFFIEARYRHFLPNSNHMSFVPISLGFRF